jgi:carbonic anhydrase
MKNLPHLFESNRAWAARQTAAKPTFFAELAAQQTPKLLWIGCSDSRVPATEICGLNPGEMFVHRNIANLVVHSDMNLLSVLAVRGGGAEGGARHRVRPLRVRGRQGRAQQ